MSRIWWATDEASMANPLGGFARGWDQISSIYARMFRNMRLEIALCDYTIHIIGSVFYATGREHGYVETSEQRIELDVRTTRVFRLEVGRWQQAHHHGSIDDPELLQMYQRALALSLEAETRGAVRH
jgi:ketosteroid isomerase-like protein